MNNKLQIFVKSFETRAVGDIIEIAGYASAETKDRHGTIVLTVSAREAITAAMEAFMKNPVMLYEHGCDPKIGKRPVGRVVEWRVDDGGLWIRAEISQAADIEDIRQRIVEGTLKGLSISFLIPDEDAYIWDEDSELFIIKRLEMVEISVVAIPSNRDTLFEVVRKHFDIKETSEMPTSNSRDIVLSPEEYRDYEKKAAQYELLSDKLNVATEDRAALAEELEHFKANRSKDTETMAALQAKLDETEKRSAELEAQIKELQDRSNVTLARRPAPSKSTEAGTSTNSRAVEEALSCFNGVPMHNLRASFLAHKTMNENRAHVDFTDTDVILFHLAQKNKTIEDTVENRAVINDVCSRAISSTTGVIRVESVDYQPIEMDNVRVPMLPMTPVMPQQSKTHSYYKRTAKVSAVMAPEGFTPVVTSSTYTKVSNNLKLMYAAFQVNDFADAVGAEPSNMALEMMAADRAMDEKLHWLMIHGDDSADSNAFDGLLVKTQNSSTQVIDNGAVVLALDYLEDLIEGFKSIMSKESTDQRKPSVIAMDPKLFAKFRKLLRAATSGLITAQNIIIGGFEFRSALVYDGVIVVECDDLRDWVTTAPTAAVAKAAGGAVTADEYFVRVSGVTANGETTASTEVSATTETTNLKLNVTITQVAACLYYKIYMGTETGVLKHVKTVANDGEASQVVSFEAVPTYYYETPLDSDEGIIIAAKLGNEDGYEFGANQVKRFVRLGKTGDTEKGYLRSYIHGVLKNPYAVVKMQIKRA